MAKAIYILLVPVYYIHIYRSNNLIAWGIILYFLQSINDSLYSKAINRKTHGLYFLFSSLWKAY